MAIVMFEVGETDGVSRKTCDILELNDWGLERSCIGT